jgi:formylmethanofuran dehydrogenase subunit E
VRMALLGCALTCISDPKGADRKKLIVWVEIDRCVTDAVSAVTGVRLGKRSLKYLDYGKVAATFLNLSSGSAVRVCALEESRALADARYGQLESRKERQMLAYRELSDEHLFKIDRVQVDLSSADMPGRPRSRATCKLCLEGINDGREVFDGAGEVVCRACAFGTYFRPHY